MYKDLPAELTSKIDILTINDLNILIDKFNRYDEIPFINTGNNEIDIIISIINGFDSKEYKYLNKERTEAKPLTIHEKSRKYIKERKRFIYKYIDNLILHKNKIELLTLFVLLQISITKFPESNSLIINKITINLLNEDIHRIKSVIKEKLKSRTEKSIKQLLLTSYDSAYLYKEQDFIYIINKVIKCNYIFNFRNTGNLEPILLSAIENTITNIVHPKNTDSTNIMSLDYIYNTFTSSLKQRIKKLNKILNNKDKKIRAEARQLATEHSIRIDNLSAIKIITCSKGFLFPAEDLELKILNIPKKHQQQRFRKADDKQQKNIKLIHFETGLYSVNELENSTATAFQEVIEFFCSLQASEQEQIIKNKIDLKRTFIKKQQTIRLSNKACTHLKRIVKAQKLTQSELISIILNFQYIPNSEIGKKPEKDQKTKNPSTISSNTWDNLLQIF